MKKIKVRMYPDEASANAALVRYIMENDIVDTEFTSFWNDTCLDFEYIGMKAPADWYGEMYGVQLTNDEGETVIFASWFSPYYKMEFEDCFAKVMKGFSLLSTNEESADE